MKQTSLLLLSIILFACVSTKNTINFEKVKTGSNLESATEITPNKFMDIWLQNHKKQSIYNMELLYQDSIFSYFGRYYFDKKSKKQKPKLFKVKTDSLITYFPNYQQIKGEDIRNLFYNKIVPKKDKQKWEKTKCNQKSSSQKYVYRTLSPYKVEITLKWKVKCGTSTIYNAEYTGTYLFKQNKIISN